ncbi:hypothetical protein NC652_019982 [Populus alba x Populus x berolinensis]|nr:hypothetical protein NC652_019982 [Populus alba x Populus x berolinensis]
MYASATCSTSYFLPQTAKRFDSVSFAAFRLRCPHVCFCYLFYITLLPQTAKRFDSVSFAAFRLRCPGCRNSVAFEFRVIPLEHVCFCYLFYITLPSAKSEITVIAPALPGFAPGRAFGLHAGRMHKKDRGGGSGAFYIVDSVKCSTATHRPLLRGVRVIELDLWPGSAKDEILVLHGRTLTTPVPLIKCLKSIRDYAFASSPYPVIITLEDHLTPELQAKVAEMVTQTFGGMLYYPESDSLLQFPSPESLKHRIIISTKPPKEYLESSGIKRKGPLSPGGRNSSEEDDEASGIPYHTAELEADDRSDSDQDDVDLTDCDNKSGQLGAPGYKRLITIHAGKPKGCLKDALKVAADKVRRLSLSEQELEKAAATNGTDVVRFTQNNILRIYPKGTRITSSNYKPIVGWMHGAQMIAFNMQGYGKSLWLMHGMFRANGGCGYLKKPDFLLEKGPNNEVFDPKTKLPVTKTLNVKVYLGDGWRLDFSHTHFDSYSPPDFYTKVYIVGVPADAAKRKTKIIEDNWSPAWNEEFTFPLTVPELALLRVEVQEYDMSDKDDFGGQTCLPVLDLRPGIRSVPLHDKKGEKLKNVRLLMGFQFV